MNKTELIQLINSTFPDNNQQEISAADLRAVTSQMVNSDLNLFDTTPQYFRRRFVIINDESDWPQNETQLLAEPQTTYAYGDQVVTAKTIVAAEGMQLLGQGELNTVHVYTGTGNMVESNGVNFTVHLWSNSCPLGTAWNITGGFVILEGAPTFGGCGRHAALNSCGITIKFCSAIPANQGIECSGTMGVFLVEETEHFGIDPAFTGVNYGSATFETISISNYRADGVPGSYMFSSDAFIESGNVQPGELAIIEKCKLRGSGIGKFRNGNLNEQDTRFKYVDNSPQFEDSRILGNFYMNTDTGSSPQTIAIPGGDANVFQSIGNQVITATFEPKDEDRFLFDPVSIELVYLGERDIDLEIIATAKIDKAGGGTDNLQMEIAKNWTYIAADPTNTGELDSKSGMDTNNPQSVTSTCTVGAQKFDRFGHIFRNQDGTSNPRIFELSMIIKAIM